MDLVDLIPVFEKKALYYRDGNKFVEVPDSIAVVNSESVVGIVSDVYKLVQPRELIVKLLQATKMNLLEVHAFGGRVAVKIGDRNMKMYVLNSVDTTTSLSLVPVFVSGGIELYGQPLFRRVHKGDIDSAVSYLLKDINKIKGNVKLFIEGLSKETTEEFKNKVIEYFKLDSKSSRKSSMVLLKGRALDKIEKATTYLDIYKAVMEYMNGRRLHSARRVFDVVSFVHRVLADAIFS